MASSISDRRQGRHDGRAGDAANDETITQADARSVAIGFGFHAFDVGEEELLLLKGDFGAVRWIASSDLLQVVAEDLWPESCGYVAQGAFGFRIVHDPTVRRSFGEPQPERVYFLRERTKGLVDSGNVASELHHRAGVRRRRNVAEPLLAFLDELIDPLHHRLVHAQHRRASWSHVAAALRYRGGFAFSLGKDQRLRPWKRPGRCVASTPAPRSRRPWLPQLREGRMGR